MKRISFSLTKKGSLERAINELEAYRKSLEGKEELFCQRLADIGVNAAMQTLAFKGQGDSDRSASFDITFEVEDRTVHCKLSVTSTPTYTADGRVYYPHLGWEFGAGNYFNGGMTSPNPDAGKVGLGPGTFPDQTHVPEPGWWYYRDENGEAVRSYGTQATMPMYTATVEMIRSIEAIAKEVYGGR